MDEREQCRKSAEEIAKSEAEKRFEQLMGTWKTIVDVGLTPDVRAAALGIFSAVIDGEGFDKAYDAIVAAAPNPDTESIMKYFENAEGKYTMAERLQAWQSKFMNGDLQIILQKDKAAGTTRALDMIEENLEETKRSTLEALTLNDPSRQRYRLWPICFWLVHS